MKLGIISDLHIDVNQKRKREGIVHSLIEVTKEKRVEALCIAGDVSNNYRQTLIFLEQIEQELGIPCYFVAGNHDLWNIECPGERTWDIYERLKSYRHNLANGPQLLKSDWVLLGDIGWFDFTLGNYDKYSLQEFRTMKLKGGTWQDKEYTEWAERPEKIHHYFLEKLRNELERYKDKNIIMCTHMVNHRHFTVPTPHRVWDYFNAFLGSKEYEQLIGDYPVRYAICGHVHFRKSFQKDSTTFICSCLGYVNQWRCETTKEEVEHALYTIEI